MSAFWKLTWTWAFVAEIHVVAGAKSGVSFDPAHWLLARVSVERKIPVGIVPSGFWIWNGKSRAVPWTSSKKRPMGMVPGC